MRISYLLQENCGYKSASKVSSVFSILKFAPEKFGEFLLCRSVNHDLASLVTWCIGQLWHPSSVCSISKL